MNESLNPHLDSVIYNYPKRNLSKISGILDFLPLRRLIDDQYHFLGYLELAELELETHELFQDKYHVMNHSEMYMYGVALGDAV